MRMRMRTRTKTTVTIAEAGPRAGFRPAPPTDTEVDEAAAPAPADETWRAKPKSLAGIQSHPSGVPSTTVPGTGVGGARTENVVGVGGGRGGRDGGGRHGAQDSRGDMAEWHEQVGRKKWKLGGIQMEVGAAGGSWKDKVCA
jgi:hypothetical protein